MDIQRYLSKTRRLKASGLSLKYKNASVFSKWLKVSSALELLETKDGRDLLRKEISAKDLRSETLSKELISDQFESINPKAGE
jgi:hypothetical protein